MNIRILILLVISNFNSFAQSNIGEINDPDGYTNIRLDKNINSPIIGRVNKDEKFTYFLTENSNWFIVEFEGIIGYMNKSRVKFIEEGYLSKNGNILSPSSIEITKRELQDVTIQFIQIKPKGSEQDFYCNARIRTIKNNKIIDQVSYNSIEPVGSDYGITFVENQELENLFIALKYGDYEGHTIIIKTDGTLSTMSGGAYFITNNKQYVISSWYSDLSGVTTYNRFTDQIKEIEIEDFHISDWYLKNGKYLVNTWENNRATNNFYEFDLDNLSFKKSELKADVAEKVNLYYRDCYCKTR